jgi:hypothetical protein
VIRRATIDRLRSDGLLTDDQTRPASRSGPYLKANFTASRCGFPAEL